MKKKYIIHPGFIKYRGNHYYITCENIIKYNGLKNEECLKDYGERSLVNIDITKFENKYATEEILTTYILNPKFKMKTDFFY